MKIILWLLALFAAAVAVTLTAKYNTGHASIEMPPYHLELSLDHFVIGLVALFFIFYVLVRLILGLVSFSQRYRHRKTDEMLLTGIKAYLEGDYVKSQKNTATALKLSDSPITTTLSAVIAARSAFNLDDKAVGNDYLSLAANKAPDEKSLCLITKAEFLLSESNHQAAFDTLQSLYAEGGLQPSAALMLELQAQQQAQNWDAVLELVDMLENRQSINKAQVRKLRQDALIENIKSKATDTQSLDQYWQHHISPMDKMDSRLAVAVTRAYISLGNCVAAHKIIEQNVAMTWDSELIELYAECLDYHVNRQIECAEVWLKAQPNNAQLLLTLGKLCTHCELWGKAQNYLEASLSVEPGHKAHFALAQLHEKLGKHELAMDHYNKGLDLTFKQLS